MQRIFYHFPSNEHISDDMSDIVGGKGLALNNLSKIGVNVPPGFTISSEICKFYYLNSKKFPEKFFDQIGQQIILLEKSTSKKFGDGKNPLLFSVRSGSKFSMPGMMDTILNLGINDEIAETFVKYGGDYNFIYDCYRRFIQIFANVVYSIPSAVFEHELENIKSLNSINNNHDISYEVCREIIASFKKIVKDFSGHEIELDPYKQINLAIISVINSWNSERAIIYRNLHNLDNNIGTAVNIQCMVYGNMNMNSATGVLFTRNPTDGKKEIFGEYLINAQGEEIVSGVRTPLFISGNYPNTMEKTMPEIYIELKKAAYEIENYYKDMQDIEFTIEDGKLYILQSRSGKRTAISNIKIAYELYNEGIITKEEALLQIDTSKLDKLLHSSLENTKSINPIAKGLAASPGAAVGVIALSSAEVEKFQKLYGDSKNIILIRNDTSPEDIKGMLLASAIITARGGLTSHAAVVARGIGRACICGVSDIEISSDNSSFKIGDKIFKSGDLLSVDGSTGHIFSEKMEILSSELPNEFLEILNWSKKFKKLKVRANAETIEDVKAALNFGAEGIGLCRTEHMFFDSYKILQFQSMILELDPSKRDYLLKKIEIFHKDDFASLFDVIAEKPFTIRLLDPPLHEFLPKTEDEIKKISDLLSVSQDMLRQHIKFYTESNPMLGHRGCRLGITHIDIYKMQVNAIFKAASEYIKKNNNILNIEIMFPLISTIEELLILKDMIISVANSVMNSYNLNFSYKIGTMIELPRAVMISDILAKYVDFFSYGTNDLTQTIFGISRDDVSGFMHDYKAKGIFKNDPFVTIDTEGVGEFIKISTHKGKDSNKNLSIGICGEHGGDPESIIFFNNINADYISCSPYRIYKAIIAAAQAEILEKKNLEKLN